MTEKENIKSENIPQITISFYQKVGIFVLSYVFSYLLGSLLPSLLFFTFTLYFYHFFTDFLRNRYFIKNLVGDGKISIFVYIYLQSNHLFLFLIFTIRDYSRWTIIIGIFILFIKYISNRQLSYGLWKISLSKPQMQFLQTQENSVRLHQFLSPDEDRITNLHHRNHKGVDKNFQEIINEHVISASLLHQNTKNTCRTMFYPLFYSLMASLMVMKFLSEDLSSDFSGGFSGDITGALIIFALFHLSDYILGTSLDQSLILGHEEMKFQDELISTLNGTKKKRMSILKPILLLALLNVPQFFVYVLIVGVAVLDVSHFSILQQIIAYGVLVVLTLMIIGNIKAWIIQVRRLIVSKHLTTNIDYTRQNGYVFYFYQQGYIIYFVLMALGRSTFFELWLHLSILGYLSIWIIGYWILKNLDRKNRRFRNWNRKIPNLPHKLRNNTIIAGILLFFTNIRFLTDILVSWDAALILALILTAYFALVIFFLFLFMILISIIGSTVKMTEGILTPYSFKSYIFRAISRESKQLSIVGYFLIVLVKFRKLLGFSRIPTQKDNDIKKSPLRNTSSGTKLASTCPLCGASILTGSKFCISCGYKVITPSK